MQVEPRAGNHRQVELLESSRAVEAEEQVEKVAAHGGVDRRAVRLAALTQPRPEALSRFARRLVLQPTHHRVALCRVPRVGARQLVEILFSVGPVENLIGNPAGDEEVAEGQMPERRTLARFVDYLLELEHFLVDRIIGPLSAASSGFVGGIAGSQLEKTKLDFAAVGVGADALHRMLEDFSEKTSLARGQLSNLALVGQLLPVHGADEPPEIARLAEPVMLLIPCVVGNRPVVILDQLLDHLLEGLPRLHHRTRCFSGSRVGKAPIESRCDFVVAPDVMQGDGAVCCDRFIARPVRRYPEPDLGKQIFRETITLLTAQLVHAVEDKDDISRGERLLEIFDKASQHVFAKDVLRDSDFAVLEPHRGKCADDVRLALEIVNLENVGAEVFRAGQHRHRSRRPLSRVDAIRSDEIEEEPVHENRLAATARAEYPDPARAFVGCCSCR